MHVLDTETFTWSQPITTVITVLTSVKVTALQKFVPYLFQQPVKSNMTLPGLAYCLNLS